MLGHTLVQDKHIREDVFSLALDVLDLLLSSLNVAYQVRVFRYFSVLEVYTCYAVKLAFSIRQRRNASYVPITKRCTCTTPAGQRGTRESPPRRRREAD